MTSPAVPHPSRAAVLALLVCVAWLLGGVPAAGSAAASNRAFPALLTLNGEGEARALAFTGAAQRKILLFKVYEIAHYAAGGAAALSPSTVLDAQRDRALMIVFQRTLRREQIAEEFTRSLARNAQDDWLAQAEGTIEAFIAAIDRDARKGDTLVFYWLDQQQLIAQFNGEQAFAANDPTFARLIWSIWFGEDPVCDRDALLAGAAA